MHHSLPHFPPLFPSGKWWGIYASNRLSGLETKEAIGHTNAASGMKGRDWMRFSVDGNAMLYLPVAGGASALKNHKPTSWRLANEARRERRKISSTLTTLYGPTPYYQLIPNLFGASIEDSGILPNASDVTLEAFHNIEFLLGLNDDRLLHDIREAMNSGSPRLRSVCTYYRRFFNPDLSIIDTLAKIGPCAIFALLPAF